MSELEQLIKNARDNEIIARNLFEIEAEIMNITQCSDFFEQLIKMVRDKFSIEYAWVTMADIPANQHFIDSLAQIDSEEPFYKKVAMIDFLQATKSTREPILVDTKLSNLKPMIPSTFFPFIRSVAILPLIIEKKVVGSLVLGSPDAKRYSPSKDNFFLQHLAVKVSLSLVGVWARERVSFLATRDPLTHLRNRRELEESLEQELSRHQRQREHMALMFIDCDDFKPVNDTHGHEVGDLYLKHVAQLLLEETRKSDLVFRFAGDEFVILLPNQKQEGADIIASRIREHVSECPLSLGDVRIPVKLSYGVTSTETIRSYDSKKLLKTADERLYDMKALKPSKRSYQQEKTA